MDIGYSVTNGSDPFDCNRFRVDDSGPFSHLKHPMLSFSPTNGFSDGRMDGEMHRWCAGIKGLFTPAQWIELEHQAMIYKYLTANVPVPSNLLIPIRKAIQSAAFSGFSIGSFPSHSYGWGSFHLGFSSNSDSEPGRCRRTDGKKWRCSREAVPDQKYCERHINRGRHRSRKPVESHIGHTASAVPTTTSVMPSMSVSMTSLVTSGGGCFTNDVTVAQHQINMGLQPTGATAASTDTIVKCLKDRQGTSAGKQYSFEKQQISFEESSVSDFGIVSDDSLLNPSQKIPCFNGKNYEFLHEYDLSQQNGNPEWVQLSMSNPTSSFPNHEKISVSSSSFTREFDPFQTRLGVEVDTKRNEWIPNSTGGGPLGEVLVSNLSTQLRSSRTGVL